MRDEVFLGPNSPGGELLLGAGVQAGKSVASRCSGDELLLGTGACAEVSVASVNDWLLLDNEVPLGAGVCATSSFLDDGVLSSSLLVVGGRSLAYESMQFAELAAGSSWPLCSGNLRFLRGVKEAIDVTSLS